MRYALLIAGLLLSPTTSVADSRCSATNEAGTQTCAASCPAGQVASCDKATGSERPSCHCGVAPVATSTPQPPPPPPGPSGTPK